MVVVGFDAYASDQYDMGVDHTINIPLTIDKIASAFNVTGKNIIEAEVNSVKDRDIRIVMLEQTFRSVVQVFKVQLCVAHTMLEDRSKKQEDCAAGKVENQSQPLRVGHAGLSSGESYWICLLSDFTKNRAYAQDSSKLR